MSDVWKYIMRGGVEWQMQHKAKLSVVLTGLLFCIGRVINSNSSDGPGMNVYKQIKAMIHYPKNMRWSMLNTCYIMITMDKRAANSVYYLHNGKQ